MKYVLFFAVCATLLVSCIGMQQTITVNEDGSGSVSYTYRIAKEFADLGSYGDLKQPVALPVHKADFERIVSGNKGLALAEYSTTVDPRDLIVHAVISFASISDLDRFTLPDGSGIRISKTGDGSRLQYDIPGSQDAGVTTESLAMIDEMSAGYAIGITLKAPRKVTSHTLGEIMTDGKTVTYATTLSELVRNEAGGSFVVTW